MNLIVICIDSLRQDHVSCYAGDASPVPTPNIDAFAHESVVFDNIYPEALPTIPIRTQLMAGQRTLPYRRGARRGTPPRAGVWPALYADRPRREGYTGTL